MDSKIAFLLVIGYTRQPSFRIHAGVTVGLALPLGCQAGTFGVT